MMLFVLKIIINHPQIVDYLIYYDTVNCLQYFVEKIKLRKVLKQVAGDWRPTPTAGDI